MKKADVKALLDEAYDRYACPAFITDDPIQVPRAFHERADAETIGFITATIAWGQRRTIIRNAWELVRLFDEQPHEFVMHASRPELDRLDRFVHRTFNGVDLRHFVLGLRHLYRTYGGIEETFVVADGVLVDARDTVGDTAPSTLRVDQCGTHTATDDMATMIARFRQRFFEPKHEYRTGKHVADPSKGSNAKRINMYLRWMVRSKERGVDMGHWQRITPAMLRVPLDVHTGRVARELGLLKRTQDDWRAVEELTSILRNFDPVDPMKYDIALFGMGVEAGK